MTDNECRCRLREASTGRLTLLGNARTGEITVSYVAEGDLLVIARQGPLARSGLIEADAVSFDIDESAAATASQWHIHIRGQWEASQIWHVPATRTNLALVLRIATMRGWHLVGQSVLTRNN